MLAEHYLSLAEQVAICNALICASSSALQLFSLYQLDIVDKNALAVAIDDFSGVGLDLLIVSAGLYFNTPNIQFDPMTVLQML